MTQHIFRASILALMMIGAAVTSATTYDYDDAGRLTRVIYDNGMQTTFTYDDNGNLTEKTTTVVNSVDEESRDLSVTIAPNPTSETLTIKSSADGVDRVEIMFVALTGEVVLRTQRFLNAGQCTVDVQHLATGTYQVQVVQGKTSSSTSLVIQR